VINNPPSGAKYAAGSEYPIGPIFVRIRAVDTSGYSVQDTQWSLPQYNAQQILSMITDLHPQVLERMTTNVFNWTAPVPVCSTCQAMNYGQFLNASMYACQCYIIPRLDMNLWTGNGTTFLQEAKYLLSVPVYPRFSILSVDNWGTFCASSGGCSSCAFDKQVFAPLYAMGWKGIGVLNAGSPYYGTCGWATYVDFDISSNNWTVNQNLLSEIKADSTVQKILLYAPDFPGQAQKLETDSPDQIANIITTIASQQSKYGYTYVYNIVQPLPNNGIWDTKTIITSSAHNGQSLYAIMRGLMQKYNSQ
jgi:hypothetical protein